MKKNFRYILIIILISIVSMLPILSNTRVMGHDTNFHIANINALKEDLDTIIPNKILPNIGNNFGYGTHLFYPPLPHYSTAYLTKITEVFKLDTLDTLTLIYLLITITSGISIFYLAKKITKNNTLALLSSIIFLLMPYRLGDILVRGALNESFTFIFMPLILLSFLELIDNHKKKFLILFVISYTALIYSHLIITIYFTLFLIPFIIIYRKELFSKEIIITILKAIGLVTLLVLPIIIPLIEQRFNGNYLVFKDNYLSGIDYVKTFSNTLKDYVTILPNYSWEVPRFIHMTTIIMVFISLIIYIISKNKNKFITFLIIFTIIAFIVSLSIFPWEYVPDFLYMIQFPWRCETMLIISLSIIAPLCLTYIKKNTLRKKIIIITTIIILITQLPFLNALATHTYLTINNVDPNLGMGHSREYLPVNTSNNMNYFDNRDNQIKIINGLGDIIINKNSSKKLSFTVKDSLEEITIELPRLYYTGYSIKSKNGTVIHQKENNMGFLEVTIKGNGTYYVTFPGTTLDRITNVTAIASLIYLTYFTIKKEKH